MTRTLLPANVSGPPRPVRAALALVSALGLAAATSTTLAGPAGARADRGDTARAPLVRAASAQAIDGRYIVVLDDGATSSGAGDVRDLAEVNGGTVRSEFDTVLQGFSATLPDDAVEELRQAPQVAYIEADQRVRADATQTPAPWGLDRIDQRALPLDNGYRHTADGSGVTAYVIDTGILASHQEFGGRVGSGHTSVQDGRGTSDCNGHGTHVAGTVGGSTYGVAKQVSLRPVRVLDCTGNGTVSGIIAGVEWVTADHAAGAPAVANMSLGVGISPALDTAVNSSIADGVTYVLSGGNETRDACGRSPSRVPSAITVGSTTRTDARSSFSNYGSCLDLFAPGSSITSAGHGSTTATRTLSGTSMAAPHVAGVAALYLQGAPSATPATVTSAILAGATPGVVTNPGPGSPNRLLHAVLDAEPPPSNPPSTPPSTPPSNPSDNLLVNPGFESGAASWAASSRVITSASGAPARTGSWKAWLGGNGTSRTETLSQSVTIPAAGSASLTFHLYVRSAETTRTRVYDRLAVQVVSGGTATTLRSFSNLDEGPAYGQRTIDVSAFAGRTVTLRFTGSEDSSLATSFVIDDTSVTTG